MRIGFHVGTINRRGTSVAIWDYAHYSEELLGHEALVVTRKFPDPAEYVPEAEARYRERFPIALYDEPTELDDIIRRHKLDVFYVLKAGFRNQIEPTACWTIHHAVFGYCEPHGDVYAYISPWLARKAGEGRYPWVPHVVAVPPMPPGLRPQLGIPETARVFGRHGGATSFDIPWVQSVVHDVARERPDLYFLFMGTDPFCPPLPNIIHLDPEVDPVRKARFVATCDAMLHASKYGESFGLAIAEFAAYDRPIITFDERETKRHSKSHFEFLGDRAVYYESPEHLAAILRSFPEDAPSAGEFYRESFSPEKVMAKFQETFLDPAS